ncbi:hypothetical protein [Vreelandella sp. EE27]
MHIPEELVAFINKTESQNKTFNSIRTTSGIAPLAFLFWSIEEIESALEMREEWGVTNCLIPFYGDWHNLFCIKLNSVPMEIVEVGDDRIVHNRWDSIDDFQKSLLWQDEEPVDASGVIEGESWLNL